MKKFDIIIGASKVPTDFIMTVLAILAAYFLRIATAPFTLPIADGTLPIFTEQFFFSLKSATLLIIIFAIGKSYSLKNRQTWRLTVLWLVWVMTMISYYFFIRNFPFSRLAIVYGWILTIFFIFLGRQLIYSISRYIQSLGHGRTNLIFIGNNSVTQQLLSTFRKNVSYRILGTIGTTTPKLKTIGTLSRLEYIIKRRKVDEIIQTKPLTEKQDEEILRLCDLHHVSYRFIPNISDVRRSNIEIETINTFPIISLKTTPLDGWGKIYKRSFDIIGSSLAIILFSPIMILTAIAIKLDSQGPILFSKLDNGSPVKRIGRHGQPFRFYKFRTMKPKSHNLRYTKLAKENIRGDGPLVKIKDDPRITRIGKFLRKTSIDELPQLFNAFTGKLSLVGPRAHLPEEVAKYQDKEKFVLTIKPGITGLPQVSGRSDLPFDEEIRLDRYYIENWSPLFDIKILLKTILVLLKPFKE